MQNSPIDNEFTFDWFINADNDDEEKDQDENDNIGILCIKFYRSSSERFQILI